MKKIAVFINKSLRVSFFFLCIISTNFAQKITIAFGSCADQNDSLHLFQKIANLKPDVYVALGDNIYGDTYSMDTLKAKYTKLKQNVNYQLLENSSKILAVWDDHDYGWNDIGKYYDCKNESKQIFLDFFNEPVQSERRNRYGNYGSYYLQKGSKTIQFILLDERSFRSDLKKYQKKLNDSIDQNRTFFYHLEYLPVTDSDSTILGKEQWVWLEKELSKPADVRIICSGTQFGITYNGYESWANFPKEQEKMLQVIHQTKAENVVFISGDVHYSEISKLLNAFTYPIYDITSSGISETWLFAAPNTNRIEGPIMDTNFGLLTIDFNATEPGIRMEIWDNILNQRIEHFVYLSELKF